MRKIYEINVHNVNRSAGEDVVVTRHVVWKNRGQLAGWTLVDEASGRELGWIVRDNSRTGSWQTRVCASAFRGTGEHDTGDLLDLVPLHLFNGLDRFSCYPVAYSRDMWNAAYDIVAHLVQHRAPAAGFDRHPQVRVWADRVRS